MTWQELADFINNEMPECNRDQPVCIWNCGDDGKAEMLGGQFCYCDDVSPFNADDKASPLNYYSLDFNGENATW